MAIIFGAVALILGCIGAFAPDLVFEIQNDIRNQANGEPTKLWLIYTRVAGAVAGLIGLGLIVWQICDIIAGR